MEFTIGTGNQSYKFFVYNEYELVQFLQSPQSLISFVNDNIMIQHVANMFQISIVIFTFNVQGNLPAGSPRHRWTRITPNPLTIGYSKYEVRNSSTDWTCYLLHEDTAHFELLVKRPLKKQILLMMFFKHLHKTEDPKQRKSSKKTG